MDVPSNTNFFSAGCIEPTLCFTDTNLKIGEKYPLEKLPVSELIKKDQVLAAFSDTDFSESEGFIRRQILLGPYTYFSEDTNRVLASVTGYPRVEFVQDRENNALSLHVWVEPLFELSKDRMTAYLVIKPLLFNYAVVSSEDLYNLLTKAGIVFGIDYKQLNLAKKYLQTKSLEIEKLIVAQGRKPLSGTNAHLTFKIEIGPIAGQILEDGRIDFRERKIMVPVHKNQSIATKIAPTNGKPGLTVLGERVAQKQGKDIIVETFGDARYDAEKNQIYATNDGVLSVIGDNIISVSSKLVIPGDIDYSTGNIESRNSVVIHGSVLPGFLVKTGGDLEIRGSVMSTQVAGLANIVVKGGITGNVSSITSSGDCDIHFIEQGTIRCQGNCVIRKQSYYSKIYAGGSIRCKEDSTVIGGELLAEGSITLGDVGGIGADPVFLAAGVVAQRIFHSRKLLQRLNAYKKSITQRLKEFRGITREKKLKQFEGKLEDMKLRNLRINMIPGTGLFSRPLEDKTPSSACRSLDRNEPDQGNIEINSISIDVHGTIFAGTMLQIGNQRLEINTNMSHQTFTLDDSLSHIIALPLN